MDENLEKRLTLEKEFSRTKSLKSLELRLKECLKTLLTKRARMCEILLLPSLVATFDS